MKRRGPSRPTRKAGARQQPAQGAMPSSEPHLRRAEPVSPDDVAFARRLLEEANLGGRHIYDSLPESEQAYFLRILQELVATGHSATATGLWEPDYDRAPVSLERFLDDPDFLGDTGRRLYIPWRRELAQVLDPRSAITEWIITGAIGTGKTTAAIIAMLYKLYRLTCLRDPQAYYGLLPDSPIAFGLFNLTLELAQSVSYKKFLTIFRSAPYFQRLAPSQPARLIGRIDLPKHLVCALGSSVVHALGRNMIGGILSEVNFTRSPEAHQVIELYTGIQRRLESRFLRSDPTLPNPGLLIVESSRRAQSDWLEGHMKEEAGNRAVHVTSFALWDVKTFGGPRFTIRVGDAMQKSTILASDETIPPGLPPGKIVQAPVRLRAQFERDLDGALRDVAGVATYADAPLIRDPSLVEACIDPHREHPFATESICLSIDDRSALMEFLRDDVLFAGRLGRLKLHAEAPRYIHVDPALTGDCAAMAMCHVHGSKVSIVRHRDGTVTNAETPVVIVELRAADHTAAERANRPRKDPGGHPDAPRGRRARRARLLRPFPVCRQHPDPDEGRDRREAGLRGHDPGCLLRVARRDFRAAHRVLSLSALHRRDHHGALRPCPKEGRPPAGRVQRLLRRSGRRRVRGDDRCRGPRSSAAAGLRGGRSVADR